MQAPVETDGPSDPGRLLGCEVARREPVAGEEGTSGTAGPVQQILGEVREQLQCLDAGI